MKKVRTVITICVVLAMLSMAVQVQAAERYWKAPVANGGQFMDAGNWVDAFPGDTDVANVIQGTAWGFPNAECIYGSGSKTLEALRVGAVGGWTGLAVMNMSGGQITTGANGTFIGMGTEGLGQINQTGGTFSGSAHFVIGQAGGTGTMNMSGGSITNPWLYIGNIAGSTGTLNFSGTAVRTGSEFFVGNSGGVGTLNMSGGTINSNNYFVVGQAGANGTMTMTGGTINAYNFWVANSGSGSVGRVHLDGGLIIVSNNLAFDQGTGQDGQLDITGGALRLPGYVTSMVGYGSGHVTAYGGSGSFVYTFDGTSNTTTITATNTPPVGPPVDPPVGPTVMIYSDTITLRQDADMNQDCGVDFSDFAFMASFWLQDDATADIAPPGGDNIVDFSPHFSPRLKWR